MSKSSLNQRNNDQYFYFYLYEFEGRVLGVGYVTSMSPEPHLGWIML